MKKTIIKNSIPDNISNKANSKYDFHMIKSGESCLYEGDKRELLNVRSASIEYSKRHKLKFVTRTNDKGLMVYNVTKEQKQTSISTKETEASTIQELLQASGVKPHNPFIQ